MRPQNLFLSCSGIKRRLYSSVVWDSRALQDGEQWERIVFPNTGCSSRGGRAVGNERGKCRKDVRLPPLASGDRRRS